MFLSCEFMLLTATSLRSSTILFVETTMVTNYWIRTRQSVSLWSCTPKGLMLAA